jgi:maltoporin
MSTRGALLALGLVTFGRVAVAGPQATKDAAEPAGVTRRVMELLQGFRFGTYGRIGYSSDLRQGSTGKPVNVVAHGPRLEEPPYVEIDLGYELLREDAISFRGVFTLAFLEGFFHYDGDPDGGKVVVRNLYLEADHVLTSHLSLWAGSRMYRGDDIYLLDFWPLDNLNTLGGGARLTFGRTRLLLHAGVNRLNDRYQLQEVEVPSPRFGSDTVTVLDRQRLVTSVKGVREFPDAGLPFKVALYGELHHLPSGVEWEDDDRQHRRAVPADYGWVAGVQLGCWGFGDNSFVNLWARAAGGIAAYGEMGVPPLTAIDLDRRTTSSRDVVLALSGNYERGLLGLMLGGYTRYFRDGDGVSSDPDDGWEYVAVLRPHLFLHRFFHQIFELSYQGRRPNGLDPVTETHLVPSVLKLSVMPAFSWDRGTYSRPQLRLLYTVSYLDAGARLMFPEGDPRRGVAVRHFVGVQVEWWYNSSYR